MRVIKNLVYLIFFFFLVYKSNGQTTIWNENFNSYTNGSRIGTGTGASPADWSSESGVSVQGGLIYANDTNNPANAPGSNPSNPLIWSTNTIDISSFLNVSFSIDANAFDVSELENSDNFSIEYRINSGGWITVFSGSGNAAEPINSPYIIENLSGNTLEIRCTFHNTFTNETYTIDNVLVAGDMVISNDPPVITATGNQAYCPGGTIPVVETISITDADDTTANEVSIQISSGYINGEDLLTLTGSHPTIIATWSSVEGKLTLEGPTTLTAFEAAIAAVEYASSATNPTGTREFSITIGDPNFLPSTGHYYEFIPDVGITWTEARDATALRTYYGLQGYLATLTSQEEADFSGTQAVGVGWIGASDATTEGDWQWVTGPEAGTSFWSGGVGGTELTFAFWNNGEPNDHPSASIPGEENYAHISDNSIGILGSWNDLPNEGIAGGPFEPQGYIVEYGDTSGDPIINVSASTSITIEIPTITGVTPDTRCGTGIVNLEATASSGVIMWYATATGGSSLATGTSYDPSISSTTTYYVDATANGCTTTSRTAVVGTVNGVPTITVQPSNQSVFVNNTVMFSINAFNIDTYQWQLSTDGGTNFNNISNGTEYLGVQTATLSVLTPEVNKNNYQYRVLVSNSVTGCTQVFSTAAILTINVRTVITNRRITYRVKKN